MERETHETRLLKYLQEHESITSLDAVRLLHNTRISATIFNLRKKGYNIVTTKENGKNVYGDKVEYGRYILRREADGR